MQKHVSLPNEKLKPHSSMLSHPNRSTLLDHSDNLLNNEFVELTLLMNKEVIGKDLVSLFVHHYQMSFLLESFSLQVQSMGKPVR